MYVHGNEQSYVQTTSRTEKKDNIAGFFNYTRNYISHYKNLQKNTLSGKEYLLDTNPSGLGDQKKVSLLEI